jgi:hypothetical protein
MLDLVACSFPIIDSKLGATLPNLLNQKKLYWDKKLRAFMWQLGAQTSNKGGTTLQIGISSIEWWWLEPLR